MFYWERHAGGELWVTGNGYVMESICNCFLKTKIQASLMSEKQSIII
jgi:hypothetical protein